MTAAPRAIPPSVNGWNAAFVESEYERFQADPTSVAPDLRAFFQGFDLAHSRLDNAGTGGTGDTAGASVKSAPAGLASGGMASGGLASLARDLVRAFRRFGHIESKIDPFGRQRGPRHAHLKAALAEAQPFLAHQIDAAPIGQPGRLITLAALVEHLERVYCGSIAIEFDHLENPDEIEWLVARIEHGSSRPVFTPEQRRAILASLTKAEEFEKYLQKRYPGDKRFSLEGCEALIPTLHEAADSAADQGVAEIVIGMAHRGRLNVLNNVLGKTYEQIFTEFEDNYDKAFAAGGGDVKYHKGYSGQLSLAGQRMMQVTLAPNPSHLESVNPVVLGRCRAKQRLNADLERRKVMPILIHGDGAIAGQGIVAECLNFSQIEGYRVGGTLHVVINNQIAFTTTPEDGRSTRYCTDIAKAALCPVFHVNAEDPEACVAMARIAVQYRQKFAKDVFIDLVGFRRYGHNEQDEQSFTQPILAEMISAKFEANRTVLGTYASSLLAEGVITREEHAGVAGSIAEALEQANKKAKASPKPPDIDPGGDRWKGITGEYSHDVAKTGVPSEVLEEVAAALGRVPEGFNVNPKLLSNPKLKTKGVLETRASLASSDKIAHADAELLAFGTLLLEGIPVRLSGQDARRGTFSQRHAVLRDAKTGDAFVPLNTMRDMGVPGMKGQEPGSPGPSGKARQARFCVYDSPLSEEAVMGFDYGYSLADPNMIVCWEGQFGDFNNGAQTIIDQYIASAEVKWHRWSGLVLLLPHGYEGAGPEHSSARLERFLLLCADDNMEVVYPSTAAQTFHMYRRIVKRKFRKPLIVMTPKSMLRVPTSSAEELISGSFQEVIDDVTMSSDEQRKKVKRVILCSGKFYHELHERRLASQRYDVAIVRLEQLYPLHESLLASTLAKYPASAEKVWSQEEPQNAGAWSYIFHAMNTAADLKPHVAKTPLTFIGRDASASPACGSKTLHKKEQEAILASAVAPAPAKPKAEAAAKH
ncbi:MAG: 2-oxoglutarate dehydrogenase E1 component [Planctomycetota bacterium]|nr:2-oxoglutarate dehydrogenase E1 component [Planctomycetota bacterium]